MKKTHLPLTAVFGILSLFLAGCANHLNDIDTVSQENEKNVLNVKYDLRLTPETIRDASYHVEIEKLESVDVKSYQVRTVKSIVTPYEGWRELYEVPAGIGLFPVSVCSHVLFIFSFGILPYDIPKSVTNLSFTGMNPALNWENEERSEENLVLIERKMQSDVTENVKTPVAHQEITVRSDKQSRKYTTDDFGGFDLNFLALDPADTFFPNGRKISFVVEGKPEKELRHIILTRDFLSRLQWAQAKINAYRAKPSGKDLFDTVIFLEKNGFDQLAYSLEESELARMANDRAFQDAFKAAAQEHE
ncbi:MAG: hypothetical protein J5944_05735 [Lentisphaeria bacterium]|nr:hypothetical protein [Lentisphaeria bacterium]